MSIDVLIRNLERENLLGWGNNEPARGCYFVLGGRIKKGEMIAAVFKRILSSEVGLVGEINHASFLGVFQHFYETNF